MAVCLIECQLCGEQYTGSTKTKFVCETAKVCEQRGSSKPAIKQKRFHETAKVCEQRGSSKASHKTKTFS